jgi:2'-5' RNA ligase
MEEAKGAGFTKSPNSQCVINLIPPRELWAQVQSVRTQYIPDARCGPHISFIDPFVLPHHYPEAAKLLREALADFPPFQVRLAKFGHFIHSKSATLFLEPEFDPPSAVDVLLERILSVFPQCDDTVKKGKGKFVAHVSVAKCKNENELKRLQAKLEQNYNPISFTLKEIYLLHRHGTDPFEVKEVVHLGPEGSHTPPHFGPGSPGDVHTSEEHTPLGRSLVVCGLPRGCTAEQMTALFTTAPSKSEIILNPNGRARQLGVVEFHTRQECDEEEARWPAEGKDGVYVRRLWLMVFPDVIGGSCSLQAVKSRQ